jgi:glycosyltransferase involved in cell wall biosynthesis
MLVNIITVCFNSAKTIERTIQSVIGQDYPHIRYIIIDGGSTDGTLEILSKYEYHFKGLLHTFEGLIAYLNSDDVYRSPSIISKVVNAMKDNNAEALYGDLMYYKDKKVVRYWKSGQMNKRKFLNGWMPPHPSFFAMKSLYEKHGSFKTKLKFSADYELMLRFLYKNNSKTVYLPEVIVEMQVGGVSNNSVKNRLRANAEDRLSWRINNLRAPFYTSYLKPLSKIGQWLKIYKVN